MADGPIEFEWDPEQLKELLSKARNTVSLALKYTAEAVWGEIRKKAPVDHGRLAGSFHLEEMDPLTYRIFTNVHYALFVHEGTGIYGPEKHRIVPRHAKALSFYWKKVKSHVVFRSVAGMKGRPYADQAMDAVSPRIDEFIRRAIQESFN